MENHKTKEIKWINCEDNKFKKLFIDSVYYVDLKNRPTNNLFSAISNQPDNKKDIVEYAQFYTPCDVALYSAYQLLNNNFNIKKDIVFDPCVGKGGLLISAGAVLALRFNLRGKELLSKLYGSEICSNTYIETIDNILNGLSDWISEIDRDVAKSILQKNIKNEDFHDIDLPQNCFVIANPPYKEVKGVGNLWLSFSDKIIKDVNVKSFAMIVPVSICSADRTLRLREIIKENFNEVIALHHDIRPRPLFKKIEQRITIMVAHKSNKGNVYRTTGFLTHKSGERIKVWESDFTTLKYEYCEKVFPKIEPDDLEFFKGHYYSEKYLIDYIDTDKLIDLWIRSTGRYKLLAQLKEPDEITTKWKKININEGVAMLIINDFSNGDALRWWKIFGDGRDISINKFLKNYGFDNFHILNK